MSTQGPGERAVVALHRRRPAWMALAGLLLVALAGLVSESPLAGTAAASGVSLRRVPTPSGPKVAVYPVPGSRVVSPEAQLVFRGVPIGRVGLITVVGSRSGNHGGRLLADSDGRGASFLTRRPFRAGERVTVRTSLNVVGGSHGTFGFTVAQPVGGRLPYLPLPRPRRFRGDVMSFASRPDLTPAAISLRAQGSAASYAQGDIFVGPQQGPLQQGPMIIGPDGRLIYFRPLRGKDWATDVRVQSYGGAPVLTWWQGFPSESFGVGRGVIVDSSYRQVASVPAAGGLHADLHEFRLTPRGTALITAYFPVYWDDRAAHGSAHEKTLDCVVQEIDVKTGLLLYQWDSLDHVGVQESYVPAISKRFPMFDYFHLNAVEPDSDGNLIISSRHTWAAYKVDHTLGRVIWRLGGKHSSFRMGPGASFAFQHDVRVRAPHDGYVTVFDNGAGTAVVHRYSRGLVLRLDLRRHTATRVASLPHRPQLLSFYEGNVEELSDGSAFVGWGQRPFFTQYDPRGKVVLDGHFLDTNSSYRAYRSVWVGHPLTPPDVAAARSGSGVRVSASWNGATEVWGWLYLAGPSPSTMKPLAGVHATGFETTVSLPAASYVEVQAYDIRGHRLGTSRMVQIH